MNRKMIVDFCNREIFPQVRTFQKGDLLETVKLVTDWRRKNGWPKEMTAKVDDGFLFINGSKVGRIAPKEPKAAFSAAAYYWEGRILERQGL